jgi:tRNA pseudouridine55 synthase
MDGSFIIDKPAGMTSHDVVARVRRAIGMRRVGHAGTLDPFATGVLVVCVGNAIRLVQFLVGLDKEYLATIRLGFATDTQDLTGKRITPIKSSELLTADVLLEGLKEFLGPQTQVPPMYSAKKIAGERLHHAARRGEVVERQPSPITVHSMELVNPDGGEVVLNPDGTRDFTVRVKCSSGTYVRTLAHDLGARLGVGAHLAALRRTAVGELSISRAIALDALEEMMERHDLQALLSPAETVGHLAAVYLDADDVRLVEHGRELDWSRLQGMANRIVPFDPGRPVRLCDARGELVAIGTLGPDANTIRPRVVLSQATGGDKR